MKKCSKYGKMLDRSEFYKNKNSKDGLQGYCKKCGIEYRKERENKPIKETIPIGMKRCNRCGQILDLSEFQKRKDFKDGLRGQCKECTKRHYRELHKVPLKEIIPEGMKRCCKCGELKDKSCFSKAKKCKDGLQCNCKECNKAYKLEHRDKYVEYSREYYKTHKLEIQETKRIYRIRNIDKFTKYNKDYYYQNRDSILEQKKEYGNRNATYKVYASQLTVDEAPRLSEDGVSLEAKCHYCGSFFIPTILQAGNRVKSLNGTAGGENNLYCSTGCAVACPTSGQRLWPKGFKPATSREVPAALRQMVLERDNWTCQHCGATTEDAPLHCHHVQAVVNEPMLQADASNCITLCKECHQKVHKLPGCGYSELRCDHDDKIIKEYSEKGEEDNEN